MLCTAPSTWHGSAVHVAQVHFGVRARRDERHALHMLLASFVMMVLIGVGLGCISASITLAESQIYNAKRFRYEATMWPCADDCGADESPHRAASFFVYLGMNAGLVFGAAALVYLAPMAASSGLPQVPSRRRCCRSAEGGQPGQAATWRARLRRRRRARAVVLLLLLL